MRTTTGAFPSRGSPRCSVRYLLQSAGILPNRFRNRILCDVAKIFKNLIALELDFFAKVETFYLEPILELFDFRKELRVFDGNGCSVGKDCETLSIGARRTSTFLSCTFREQEDDQAARSSSAELIPRIALFDRPEHRFFEFLQLHVLRIA